MATSGLFLQCPLPTPQGLYLNARHRFISGAGDPRCRIHLVMGKSDPGNASNYHQQSVVIVPADAPGVSVIRHMQVFGYDHAPEGHCEVTYENVRVPAGNLIYGWGRGFEVCPSLSSSPPLSQVLTSS
jgi:acyl-CoA dehydrogenase